MGGLEFKEFRYEFERADCLFICVWKMPSKNQLAKRRFRQDCVVLRHKCGVIVCLGRGTEVRATLFFALLFRCALNSCQSVLLMDTIQQTQQCF